VIIYRRDRDHAPAHEEEVEDALAEGVKVHWLRTIKSIEGSRFEVEVMELDETGRPRPTGVVETLEADDLCTGCAICFQQCPCAAITMIPEPRVRARDASSSRIGARRRAMASHRLAGVGIKLGLLMGKALVSRRRPARPCTRSRRP
jgi:coenzyme F420-reducing hydrogenase gamma subunit